MDFKYIEYRDMDWIEVTALCCIDGFLWTL